MRRVRTESDLTLFYPLASRFLLCLLFSCWATSLLPKGAALSSLLSGGVFESVWGDEWMSSGKQCPAGCFSGETVSFCIWEKIIYKSPVFNTMERRLLSRLRRHTDLEYVWIWYFVFNTITNYWFCPLVPDLETLRWQNSKYGL